MSAELVDNTYWKSYTQQYTVADDAYSEVAFSKRTSGLILWSTGDFYVYGNFSAEEANPANFLWPAYMGPLSLPIGHAMGGGTLVKLKSVSGSITVYAIGLGV